MSAADGSRLPSGPDKSFSIAMSPGAAERCTAAVAMARSELAPSHWRPALATGARLSLDWILFKNFDGHNQGKHHLRHRPVGD
jgi:hypothetical protein